MKNVNLGWNSILMGIQNQKEFKMNKNKEKNRKKFKNKSKIESPIMNYENLFDNNLIIEEENDDDVESTYQSTQYSKSSSLTTKIKQIKPNTSLE